MPMIPILSYPDVAGARYSRTSVDLVAAEMDHRIVGWTGWSMNQKLTPGKAWGGKALPQVRTRGKYEPKMTLKMWLEDWNLFQNKLAAFGLARARGFMEVSWTLIGTLYERELGTTSWVGIGCRVVEVQAEPQTSSDDPIEVSIDLDVMNVLKDGVAAVFENSPLGQAGVAG
ncbi:MAG: hypothetical protein V4537_14495 [Pseudomonadota bacterium]